MSGSGNGGGPLDSQNGITLIVTALQELIKAIYLTQVTLAKGIPVIQSAAPLTTYTVAGLPATAPMGVLAFASNGRNPGEASGAGTGCAVVGAGGGVWKSIASGAAVAA